MRKTAIKVFIIALLFYIAGFIASYISNKTADPFMEDAPMSLWDKVSLGLFALGVSMTIAAVKLRNH